MSTKSGGKVTDSSRVYRVRGRKRHKEILDTAIAQFSERGIDLVTVEDIATAVGCNKSLVYYYFGSKEGLSDAVLAELVRVNEEALSGLQAASFTDWVNGITGWWRNNPMSPWTRLSVREGLADSGKVIREEQRARVLAASTRTVARAQGAGQVDLDLDPEMISLLVLFLTVGPVALPQYVRMLTGAGPENDNFQQRYSAFVSELVERLRPRDDR